MKNPMELFVDKYKQVDTHWIWTGCTNSNGEPRFASQKLNTKLAKDASWILFCGLFPIEYHVYHTCDLINCINPQHLGIETNQEKELREFFSRIEITSDFDVCWNWKSGLKF